MSAQTDTTAAAGSPSGSDATGPVASATGVGSGVGSGLGFDPIARAREQWVEQGWEPAADGMAAITSLMRAHQIVLARVEATLKPLGVTFARYEVLMLLWFSRRGSLPMKVIGSRLQVHPTSVTNAVDRLEDAGLVMRRAHPEDRRAMLVSLTPSGRALAERATTALNTEVFEQPDLDTEDAQSLVDVLTRLRRSAGDF
ncbi:putative transcriptional regulator, MarR family protein [Terrabacter tumescens]|uniref:Transcriptional regulator, MarR family protein n=1 Tax=Terrabacter tumescens TaxID=60443 RepID=A0ABQ2HY63_9MICO|nr:MarR family transcriptional regulator [Terrabacter tumescens]GGM93460.1 putative transcriptional regulator, MarR family protein [Terrabacter tumescens]